MKVDIPLSYNPIDINGLVNVLKQYEHRHHQEIIFDFEEEIKVMIGVKHVVALSSCTAAIHLALKALDVQPGDYVITSSFTYVGSANPILHAGALPVLVDCEPIGWNIDVELLEKAINQCLANGKKPKAIIVVHNYGMPADLDAIAKLSKTFDIPIIEDAAEAVGSTYRGKPLGSFGDIGVLSFNNNKGVTAYGGGALLTNSPRWAERVLFWATQAREHADYYLHHEVGYNYRISPLNAAAGLLSLSNIYYVVQRRRQIFDAYYTALKSLGWVFQENPDIHYFSNRWLTTVMSGTVRAELLEDLRRKFEMERIEIRPLWKPLHTQPLFRPHLNLSNQVSESFFERGFCLPSGNHLSELEIERVLSFIIG